MGSLLQPCFNKYSVNQLYRIHLACFKPQRDLGIGGNGISRVGSGWGGAEGQGLGSSQGGACQGQSFLPSNQFSLSIIQTNIFKIFCGSGFLRVMEPALNLETHGSSPISVLTGFGLVPSQTGPWPPLHKMLVKFFEYFQTNQISKYCCIHHRRICLFTFNIGSL